MKSISELVNPAKIKKRPKGKRKATWYGDMGKEMTDYFGVNCFWLPYRFDKWKLLAKFKEIKTLEKNKSKSFKYFLGMLKGK